ncbi:hypothetical protein Cfor_02039, partial [Coptotermes formosanus]
LLPVDGMVKCNWLFSQFPVSRAFQAIRCWISQLELYRILSAGQNGGAQLTQLCTTPFRTAVLSPGGGTAVTAPSLVERTRSLRDWLRQARIDSADLISPGQATL